MKKRNYRKERDCYYGKKGKPKSWTKLQQKRRKEKTSRNRARRIMKKLTKVRKNEDIHHVDGNPMNNNLSNLRIVHRSKNRSNGKKKNRKFNK